MARTVPRLRTTKKTEPEPKSARPDRGRHQLSLPVRLLAMLIGFVFMVAFAVVLAKLTLEPSPRPRPSCTPICTRAAP